MKMFGFIRRLFGRRQEGAAPGAARVKEESLVAHFEKLKEVMAQIRHPAHDRAAAFRAAFPRTVADVEVTNMTVSGGKAVFSSAGKVWAFDEATQTPIVRRTGEDASSIDLYKKLAVSGFDIPDEIWAFYAQSFITWTTCAQFAQHPLINRTCAVRGEDAVAVGYEISYAEDAAGRGKRDLNGNGKKEDGDEANDYLTALKKESKRMGMDEVLRKFDYNKCVFGIGLAVPTFSGDVDMSMPFNIDARGLETYTGFTVIDPYWLVPQFDSESASDPSSKHFFEPTWWRLPNGKTIHRSWCFKCVNSHVADILKPTYIYGGIPLTQMIYERVFAADKCANEAPLLALTKRLLVVDANIQQVLADPKHVKELMDVVTYCRNNWGVMFKQPTANITQIDTALGEYDQLIMTQYQLVASIAQMPATKLLKVTPTGFQSTGEYEWKDWAQSLIDIQEMEFTPLLERHFQLLTRKRGKSVAITVKFNPVDAPTEEEKSRIQSTKASTNAQLVTSGILSVDEARDVMRNDEEGPYTGIGKDAPQKDEDKMQALMKQMGGDGNTPPKKGADGSPSGDEAEWTEDDAEWTEDDAEFERKHKRDGDGKFTRGGESANLTQEITMYKKAKGGRALYAKKGGGTTTSREEARTDKFGRAIHLYAEEARKVKSWKFPKLGDTEKWEQRKVSERNADHYNGGSREPNMTAWNRNARTVPDTGKRHLSEFKDSQLIIRDARPLYGWHVEKVQKKVKGKMRTVTVKTPELKEGKPQYGWRIGGRKLTEQEAFELESALANGGYAQILSPQARECKVRPDYANGRNEICGFQATEDSDWKAIQDPESARECKRKHIAQINAVYKHGEQIVDCIISHIKASKKDGDPRPWLAYLQLVSTARVGSPGTDNAGVFDLMPDNVKVEGDKVTLDFDAKNGRWHTTFEDAPLAGYLRDRLKETKPGERIFGGEDYESYTEYLTYIGDQYGIPRRTKGDGFTSHNLRHLSASLFASREVDKIKIDPKKDPEGYIAALEDVVRRTGEHVNDGAGVAFKSYISPCALWKNAMWLYKSEERFTPPSGR